MPRMIRVTLNDEQRSDVNRHLRAPTTAPRVRERLEMVRLSSLGHSIPAIARVLDVHHQTVRKYLKLFLVDGIPAVADRPRSGRPRVVTDEHLAALTALLDTAAQGERTWTAPQLVAWLHEQFAITVSAGWLAELLKTRRYRWKRTYRSVRHKQSNSALQHRKRADLETLNL
jgi:transposase